MTVDPAVRAATHGNSFTFSEFFSGVGGFRIGLEAAGGRCVFACEYCKFAKATYLSNWPGSQVVGDIKSIHAAQIPRHDILTAGFPCQSFSTAGKRQGFEDEKGRGKIFFHILDYITRGENDVKNAVPLVPPSPMSPLP